MTGRIRLGFAVIGAAISLFFTSGGPCAAYADEADQYLAWGHDLADAAPVINAFIEDKIGEILDAENSAAGPPCDCEELTLAIFPEIYLDRFRANLTTLVDTSGAVDVYPASSVSVDELYARSIYRNVSFPSIIRVTRTLRIGDVRLGNDKLAHFFGIGRRYYVRYLRERDGGASEAGAVQSVIRWGIFTENSVLGRRVNGIFSPADLEANYQGFMFARSLCEGETPYLSLDENGWKLARPIDFAAFVTPGFDESFNPPIYTPDVQSAVLPILSREYAPKTRLPSVAEQFQIYGQSPPSDSMRVVAGFLNDNGIPSQRSALLAALDLAEDSPAAPMDVHNAGETLRREPE